MSLAVATTLAVIMTGGALLGLAWMAMSLASLRILFCLMGAIRRAKAHTRDCWSFKVSSLKRLHRRHRVSTANAYLSTATIWLVRTWAASADSSRLLWRDPGFHMLRHLLTSDNLAKILIQLLLEDELSLSTAYEELSSHPWVIKWCHHSLASNNLLRLSPLSSLKRLILCWIMQLSQEE